MQDFRGGITLFFCPEFPPCPPSAPHIRAIEVPPGTISHTARTLDAEKTADTLGFT